MVPSLSASSVLYAIRVRHDPPILFARRMLVEMCSQGALADADVSAPDVVDAVVGATVEVDADAGDAMVLYGAPQPSSGNLQIVRQGNPKNVEKSMAELQ